MKERTADMVRMAAVFEAAKGTMVLLTGFGVFMLVHRDLHQVAEQIVRHLHLNPAREYPSIFIDLFSNLSDLQLVALAVSACIYSVVRLVEAYGLWQHRQWAEWFGVLTGGIYIPAELYELVRKVTMVRLSIFTVNVLVVASLSMALYKSRQRSHE